MNETASYLTAANANRFPSKNARVIATLAMTLAVAVLSAIGSVLSTPTPARAHGTNDMIYVVSPINGAATWDRFGVAGPRTHHIVYSNDGVPNDISVDIYAGAGSPVVTPHATRTNTGHLVESKIVRVTPACASGVISQGGYRVTVRARDTVTGVVLGYADIAHVSTPLAAGTVLGPWTVLGRTTQWNYSNCYQVTNPNGVHVHLELQNVHRYACMNNLAAGTALTGTTRVGWIGSHNYTARRAIC
jgi:hypothetical protein